MQFLLHVRDHSPGEDGLQLGFNTNCDTFFQQRQHYLPLSMTSMRKTSWGHSHVLSCTFALCMFWKLSDRLCQSRPKIKDWESLQLLLLQDFRMAAPWLNHEACSPLIKRKCQRKLEYSWVRIHWKILSYLKTGKYEKVKIEAIQQSS